MSVTAIEIVRGTAADIAIVDRIMADAFDPRFGEAWTASQCTGVLAMPGVWLDLAWIDGRAVGFALTRALVGEAELLLLATRPADRRRGVGRALLRAAIDEARDRGASALHLEVREGNSAIRLYRGEGLDKVGERRNYYRGRTAQSYDAHTFKIALHSL